MTWIVRTVGRPECNRILEGRTDAEPKLRNHRLARTRQSFRRQNHWRFFGTVQADHGHRISRSSFEIGSADVFNSARSASFGVLFNSKNNLDDDPMEGVIENGDDESGSRSQILFTERGTWLAYPVVAGVKAEGGGTSALWA